MTSAEKARLAATTDLDILYDALARHIVRQDRLEAERATRSIRGYYNPNALGIMLGAAQEALAEAEASVARGREPREAWVRAVAANFTPTRTMHTFLRAVDPRVDVARGEWVLRKREG